MSWQTFYILKVLLLSISLEKYSGQTILCSNIAPGLGRIRRGIDITRLSFLPKYRTSDDGFKRSVVDFTCNHKKTWFSPYKTAITRQTIYQVPDQIELINTLPGGLLNAQLREYKYYEDIKKTMAYEAGVGFLSGMFSSSVNYKQTQHTMLNMSKFTADIYGHFSSYETDLQPYWELSLSGSVNNFVDKFLPDKYESNPTAFKEFISQFGTHFLTKAYYGGVLKIYYNLDNELRYKLNDNQIKVDAQASFMNLIKANGAVGGTQVKISQEFKIHSEFLERYYGGSANIFKPGNWKDWSDSVPTNPWLFNGRLELLTNLMPNGPKRKSIVKATQIYLDKAYLDDLLRSCYSYISKGKIGSYVVHQYVTQAQRLLAQEIPDHNATLNLGNQITAYITVPDWYYKTILCYEWYPDGDAGQCSAPSRSLCAAVNSQTQWYRDDTDRRGGGCRMKWGIRRNPMAPIWFYNVKICFRWHPDGDGGQCGGGAPRETCAPIGQFTAVYRDDTDRRGGGCQMSWRLVIPFGSPGWLHNSKLCFSWYPDGDVGQCSGPSRNLCAVANQWTAYYRDDTDRRGGCQMSWGLQT